MTDHRLAVRPGWGRPRHRGKAYAAALLLAAVFGTVGCSGTGPASDSTRNGDPVASGGSAPGRPGSGSPSAASPARPSSAGRTGDPSVPAGSSSPTPSAGPGPSGAAGSAAALIPSAGAYLGAYVEPAEYTPQDEIASVQAFQRALGRSIALVHVYHPWNSPFPNAADRYFVRTGKVLLLTWSGTPDTRKIIAGDFDAEIRSRAEAVKRLGRPILMEFRHEMDRPNLQWAVHGPADYIAAWDHIRAIFRSVGATNVGWVWCPTGYGFATGRAQPFYPGNNEVDWVCADIYSPSPAQSLQEEADPFLDWAKHTGKPILIGEFGVGGNESDWPDWLLAAGELPSIDPQIKGMAYFDANGTDSNGHPFQYWLGNDKAAMDAFTQLLTSRLFRPTAPN